MRIPSRYSYLFAFAATVSLVGCAKPVPFALSSNDADRFGDRTLRVAVPGHDPMIFGWSNCIVEKARTEHLQITGWDVVLASDWGEQSYPKWATVCTQQSMHYAKPYLIVDLCAQAFGADGGCGGGGGTYRSRTGNARDWQFRSANRWYPLR